MFEIVIGLMLCVLMVEGMSVVVNIMLSLMRVMKLFQPCSTYRHVP